METRIGISGWRYPRWRREFYPPGLVQKKELQYASSQVNSIEINGSFYSLQTPLSYVHWYNETPEDFCFSLKGPRYITHMKKLEDFFQRLPRTVADGIACAKQADRVRPDFPEEGLDLAPPLRHALEIRSYTFENPDFIDLLRKHNVALVMADTAGLFPYMEDLASDFIYVRLHGEEKLYAGGYSEESLQWWAQRMHLWQVGNAPSDTLVISDKLGKSQPRHLYVYFDNDINTRAPFDAIRLQQILNSL